MTKPEALLRRLTVVCVCAVVIVACIYVLARLFALLAPIP